MLSLFESVVCDLCGNDDYDIFREQTLHRSLTESDFSVLGEQCECPRLVRCRRCGLVYTNPRDSKIGLDQKYEQLQIDDYMLEEKCRRLTSASDVCFMKRYISGGRVLDVGCSTGIFLSSLSDDFDPYGIEPGAQAVKIARQSLGDKAIYLGTLETAQYPDGYFTAVTMWDVLEHFFNPKNSLLKIAQFLKSSGYLFLVTPDMGSLSALFLGRRWPHFIRQHLVYFNRKTLKMLLAACGFKVVYQSTYQRRFTLRYLIKRLHFPIAEILDEDNSCQGLIARLSRMIVPVNLCDALFVVARKI